MLKQRTAVAVVGLLIIIAVVWFGDPWFSLFIAVAVLAGAFEFYHMVASCGKGRPLVYLGLFWALALALRPHYRAISALSVDILPFAMTLLVVVSLVWLLFRSPREEAFFGWAWTVAGVLYVGWMLSYWISLGVLEGGRNWIYLALFTTFANDTGAFFVGRAWGKHHLAPAISPGKTWEGAVGGLLAAVAAAIVVFIILSVVTKFSIEYWQVIVLGLLVSLFAQLGDLVESLLKRGMGVKDSGKLLPGHGGALDRLDSLIFVGATVYYYATWVVV